MEGVDKLIDKARDSLPLLAIIRHMFMAVVYLEFVEMQEFVMRKRC
jgi:hypothetical protein